MSLERYRVPASVWLGEWIELPHAGGERFLIKLPSAANREWQREMLTLMVSAGVRLTDAGEVDTAAVDRTALIAFREKQLCAFARLCVIEGPPGFDLSQLTGEYWPALVALYERASARASEEAAQADEAVGE